MRKRQNRRPRAPRAFGSITPGGAARAAALILAVALAPQDLAAADTGDPRQSLEEVFVELTDHLLTHEDRAVREAVAHALGGMGGHAAYAALEKAGFLDWPTWQYDPARSAKAPWTLDPQLHLRWVRELPAPQRAWPHQWDDRGKLDFDVSYSPVVKGNRIFVPSNVTDSVTAYDIQDGAELWRFYANGPVRLAPVAWGDSLYFVADDGYLYCLHADTGELAWKFRGGPSDHRLLGNERIINLWAARGGPVVWEGTVYFAAGFWPLHGVFIHALDAATGDVVWVNDTTSSDYVALPHGGAYGYGGLAPQGYLAADENTLVVAGGRTPPAFFDRHSGAARPASFRAKPAGGFAVHAGGMGLLPNEPLAQSVQRLAGQIHGEVFNAIAAQGALFVTTTQGALYCFGPEKVTPVRHEFRPARLRLRTAEWAHTAHQLIDALNESEGYALVLGAGSGGLLRELLARSSLHFVIVEQDEQRARTLRNELCSAGLYGRNAAVLTADPAAFSVQPYLFSLVVSEDVIAAGIAPDPNALARLLNLVRPYGGVAFLGVAPARLSALADAASAAAVDQVHLERQAAALFARRGGPLTGAGQWTHQLHDAANTLVSQDQLARLPLGLLWFGGPNNHNILPRHAGGPRPQVAGGRQVYLGVENIAARCVYTGRQLWNRSYPGIGHPFTNLALERRWADGEQVYMSNIPGATYIGSPFVTLPDSVYLRYRGGIDRLCPATGELTARFDLPGRPVNELHGSTAPDWGHVSVQGEWLITTSEPHIFEDQDLGAENSYSGTSSRRLNVLNRQSGTVQWHRQGTIGFRHNAIVSSTHTLFVIDGLSEKAIEHLARRGRVPETPSIILALDLSTGRELWRDDSNVFGTFLLYSQEHDILIEGGSQDLRRTLADEPRQMTARRGGDGAMLWERGGRFTLPAAILGERLIPGRPGTARSLITGEDWMREQPHTGERSGWTFRRTYGCNTLNASPHLLLYRTGYAGFFDLEHDTGSGTFSGFRSGCTANLIPADGVVNALDYTRTCTCSYQNQTSLALIHMPGDSNIEVWTRYDAAAPDPRGYGINLGAPGRRVDPGSGRVWHDAAGTHRRHPSAILEQRRGLDWVAASGKEFTEEADRAITLYDLLETHYTIRLHFAELQPGVVPGQRVFDVLIDGETVLNNFDIVAETGGGLRGTFKEFSVASGMTLTVELRKSEEAALDPFMNGIELIANVPELGALVP